MGSVDLFTASETAQVVIHLQPNVARCTAQGGMSDVRRGTPGG